MLTKLSICIFYGKKKMQQRRLFYDKTRMCFFTIKRLLKKEK